MRPLDIALSLIADGFAPVPVAFRGKAPSDPATGAPLKRWQHLRMTVADAAHYFDGTSQNVGVLLGEPSGWLTDLDLDSPEAIRAAPHVLPATRRQGRVGAPDSHWFYIATQSVPIQFRDPAAHAKKRSMLAEVRSTGGQTVVAGSTHTSGELITWSNPETAPRSIAWSELRRAAGDLAAAALLGRHWSSDRERDGRALALLGALRGAGCDDDRAARVVRAVLAAATVDATELDATTPTSLVSWNDLGAILRIGDARILEAARRWLELTTTAPAATGTAAATVAAEPSALAAIPIATRIDRARRWLARVRPEGHGDGSLQLVRTAAALVHGFALGEAPALQLLTGAPIGSGWTEHQLRQRCADAARGPRRGGSLPLGFKLLVDTAESMTPGDGETAERTDVANSERLVNLFGDQLRYVRAWSKGLAWEGTHWAVDDAGCRWQQAAVQTTRTMYAEARATLKQAERGTDKETIENAEGAVSWARASQSANRVAALLNLARSSSKIAVSHEALDADPWLLNVKNGTLNLRTGEVGPHRRDALITKTAPVDYDPDAEAPTWTSFLARVMGGDESLVRYLQQLVGYSLTGMLREHVLAFFFGAGANGKSTFLSTIHSLLGEYGTPAPRGVLFRSRNERHPTELATLFGRRFVTCAEIEEGQVFDEALTKDLTGGDRIKARRMREDFWTFSPTHKLFLAGNHKPAIRGDDEGIWRRMKLIPWLVIIPENERDTKLPETLRAELPGILRWAVEGCLDWQRRGLVEPEAVRAATAAYRKENDALGEFFRLHVVFETGKTVARRELRQEYESWCTDNGHTPLAARRFGARLRENRVVETTVRTGTRVLDGWKNVRLVSAAEMNDRATREEHGSRFVGTSVGTSLGGSPYKPEDDKPSISEENLGPCSDVGTCSDHFPGSHSHAHAHARTIPVNRELPPASPYVPTDGGELLADWLATQGVGGAPVEDSRGA